MENHFGSEDLDRTRKQVVELVVVIADAEGGVVIEDPIQPVGGCRHYWDTVGPGRHERGGDLGDRESLSRGREDRRVGGDSWAERVD